MLLVLDLEVIDELFEGLLVLLHYLPPDLGPARGHMAGLVEGLPEEGTGALHALEVDGILLAFPPQRVVVVQGHEGLHSDPIAHDHARLQADQGHCESIVVNLLLG